MKRTLLIICLALIASVTFSANVWTNASGDGLWENAENWTEGLPNESAKVVFNNEDAGPCTLSTEAVVGKIVLGDGAAAAALIIEKGGILTTKDGWSGVAYNADASLIVKAGATVNFASHLWIGLLAGGSGSVEIYGTVNVAQAIGSDNGDPGGREVLIYDGGVLNLMGVNALIWSKAVDPETYYNIANNGTMTCYDAETGDFTQNEFMLNGINNGWLVASDGAGEVVATFEADVPRTVYTSSLRVGINRVANSSLDMYPNPASSMVNLNVQANEVTVFNLAGQIVLKDYNTKQINVENLNNGSYIVRANVNGLVSTSKLIKK